MQLSEQPLSNVLRAAVIRGIGDWWSDKQRVQQQANAPSSPLYHYTDASGLLGIVKNQEIWFTNIFHLNDNDELSYGLRLAINMLRKIIDGSQSNEVRFFCEFFSDFVKRNYGTLFGFYVASFSMARDDLGQWRAYAANGKGFALGLSPTLFDTQDKKNRKPHQNIFFSPVIYGEKAAIERLKEIIDRAVMVITEPASIAAYEGNHAVTCRFFYEVAVNLSSPILWHAVTSKHEAFQNEREMRLIIFGDRKKLKPYIEIRVRGGEFVPFIRSKMLVQAKDAISEVVLGPSTPEMIEDGLTMMLEGFGIKTNGKIERSAIPYRSLS